MKPKGRPLRPLLKWAALSLAVLLLGAALVLLLRPRHRLPPATKTPPVTTAALRLKPSTYTRTEVEVCRPADPSRKNTLMGAQPAEPVPSRGGLPRELARAFVEPPLLAERFTQIVAGGQTSALLPYQVQFSATLADHKRLLSSAQLFQKDNELILVPLFEPLGGNLLIRWTDTTILIAIPAGTLPPGACTVTLVGARANSTWPLYVK